MPLEVIIMWLHPPPPVTDRWVLHIAATPHEIDDVLADLCIHKRARPIGDSDYPAYLIGRETPCEPPAWMSFANAELQRRAYRTLWCDPGCAHHSWPPRTELTAALSDDWPAARRHRSGASLRRLISGVPHHRGTTTAPGQAGTRAGEHPTHAHDPQSGRSPASASCNGCSPGCERL